MTSPIQVSKVVHATFPAGPRLLFENLVDRGKTYVLLAASSGCELCAAEIAEFKDWTSKDLVNIDKYAWVDASIDDVWREIQSFQAAERVAVPELENSGDIAAPAYFIVENGVIEWRLSTDPSKPDAPPGVRFYDNFSISPEDVAAALAAKVEKGESSSEDK